MWNETLKDGLFLQALIVRQDRSICCLRVNGGKMCSKINFKKDQTNNTGLSEILIKYNESETETIHHISENVWKPSSSWGDPRPQRPTHETPRQRKEAREAVGRSALKVAHTENIKSGQVIIKQEPNYSWLRGQSKSILTCIIIWSQTHKLCKANTQTYMVAAYEQMKYIIVYVHCDKQPCWRVPHLRD